TDAKAGAHEDIGDQRAQGHGDRRAEEAEQERVAERAPEQAVLPHGAVVLERQHVHPIEPEEPEEGSDRELADRQDHGDDEEERADAERDPPPAAEPRHPRRIALARDGEEAPAPEEPPLP